MEEGPKGAFCLLTELKPVTHIAGHSSSGSAKIPFNTAAGVSKGKSNSSSDYMPLLTMVCIFLPDAAAALATLPEDMISLSFYDVPAALAH